MNSSFARFALWIVAACVLVCIAGRFEVFAQPASPDAAVDAEAPVEENAFDAEQPAKAQAAPTESLGLMIVKSGTFSIGFYVVLAIFSMVALMVSVERLVYLRQGTIAPVNFVQDLSNLVARGHDSYQNLKQLADTSPTPIGRILAAAVTPGGRPLPEVEKAMEDAAIRETQLLRARNRPLTIVGNVAPLVGLLGTVVGMIFAFGTADGAGLGQGEQLAEGIYLALMTTAGGLAIAIPSMLMSAWLGIRVEKYLRDISEAMVIVLPSFARMEGDLSHGPYASRHTDGADSNEREAVLPR